ncbi:Pol polyprotein [Plakobranchus ocellatus]|uniref:Pol polyprotein n=1 Tax=Plakobranchus ocellatus TaxID=259542 RepID=A0AAV3YMP4_9GAST|nr:Pol polyprotein [Plakobranchus ocellatus]
MRAAERLSEHTRVLPPLTVGDSVRIQNQTGPHPTKWDKTGTVVEVRQFDQKCIRPRRAEDVYACIRPRPIAKREIGNPKSKAPIEKLN